MLSMSMDRVEIKANSIGLRLKDINKQLQRPLAEIDVRKARESISHLIEEMHQLDDMVHEPSYEHNCLMDYWTLKSLNDCVASLREVSDLLETNELDQQTHSLLLTKTEEISYLWNDNYSDDFGRWSKKVSGFVEQPTSNPSYTSVFAKLPSKSNPYVFASSKALEDEQALDQLDILDIDEPLMRPRTPSM